MATYFTEPPSSADVRNPHYQALKGKIHQELLGRLNLERLTRVKREDAEPEIRNLILGLLDREMPEHPAQPVRAGRADHRRPARDLRARSARGAVEGPGISDILVNRYNQVYIEREGRLEETEIVFQNDAAPLPDHRADRQHGRPSHRRVESDGRRASPGWIPCQRDHSAVGAGRTMYVDSTFPDGPHRRAGSG